MYKTELDRKGRIEWAQTKRKRGRKKRRTRIFYAACIVLAAVCAWAQVNAMICRKLEGGAKEVDSIFAKSTTKEKNGMYTEKVECVFQNPELPTGCEAAAGTMLLRAYGYEAEKTRTAGLLRKENRIEGENGLVYGPDPDDAFVGDPSDQGGFGVFPGPLAEALQQIIDSQEGVHTVRALYGLSERSILEYIDRGIPLCVWTSMYDMEIEWKTGWYLTKNGAITDEFFCWPSGEHCVVLTGYDEEEVVVCDPLEGECTYPRESFFRHYEQVGSYALVVE